MDKEPKLSPPLIDPKDVGEAILKAAIEGGQDVKVGAMAYLNTTVAKLMPGLGDKLSARRGDNQQEDIPPDHPEGTLYEPGEDRIHTRPWHFVIRISTGTGKQILSTGAAGGGF
ncbi:MAG TPA: hypothetical protein VHB01_05145 [Nitrosospira sp.]|jgi:hypothetical protein|nr:hypothetical protein [Nitrosospira sp.]